MADAPHRATVTSHTTSPDDWDAGVHAESDAGPFDVGLSVEPTALGLVVEAPGIGTLKVAFDVSGDGTTRLARASRRLADGRDVAMVALDEGERLRLEGELGREREERTTLLAEKQALEERLATAHAQLDELRNRAVAEAADARAGLAILEEQLADAGSRTQGLEAELDAARSLAEAAQGRLQKAEVELTEAALRASALESQQDGTAALEQELAAARETTAATRDGLERELQALRLELEAVRATAAEQEAELARRGEALAAAGEEKASLEARLAVAEAAPPPADQSADVTALTAQLEAVREALLASQTELAGRDEALSVAFQQSEGLQSQLTTAEGNLALQQQTTAEARDVARRYKAQADALLAERDEARGVARQLHQRLAALQGTPTETDVPVTREGTPTDPLIKKGT